MSTRLTQIHGQGEFPDARGLGDLHGINVAQHAFAFGQKLHVTQDRPATPRGRYRKNPGPEGGVVDPLQEGRRMARSGGPLVFRGGPPLLDELPFHQHAVGLQGETRDRSAQWHAEPVPTFHGPIRGVEESLIHFGLGQPVTDYGADCLSADLESLGWAA